MALTSSAMHATQVSSSATSGAWVGTASVTDQTILTYATWTTNINGAVAWIEGDSYPVSNIIRSPADINAFKIHTNITVGNQNRWGTGSINLLLGSSSLWASTTAQNGGVQVFTLPPEVVSYNTLTNPNLSVRATFVKSGTQSDSVGVDYLYIAASYSQEWWGRLYL